MFYLADGNIKIRLTDKNGLVVIAADNLLVIGPSAGGGGGGGVDPTTVMQTGDFKARFGTGALQGFVRCNGLTIGNAVSGATERANADTQPAFEYLWALNLTAVTPSRGASATADYNAGKQIAVPDCRGRALVGLDDMGATAIGRLTAAFFGQSAIVLGNAGGDEKHTMAAANIALHKHRVQGNASGMALMPGSSNVNHVHPMNFVTGAPVNIDNTSGVSLNHKHPDSGLSSGVPTVGPGSSFGTLGTTTTGNLVPNDPLTDVNLIHYHPVIGTTQINQGTTGNPGGDHRHAIDITSDDNQATAPTPLATAMPAMVVTIYLKL